MERINLPTVLSFCLIWNEFLLQLFQDGFVAIAYG